MAALWHSVKTRLSEPWFRAVLYLCMAPLFPEYVLPFLFIPGLIGPAIGTAVLRNAEQILNSDGTYSFLPSANIFLAALLAAVVLGAVLCLYLLKRNSERSDSHA